MVMKRDKPRVPPSYQSFAALFACLLAVVERCGLLPEVAAAALVTFLAVAALTLQHTNEVRCHMRKGGAQKGDAHLAGARRSRTDCRRWLSWQHVG